MSLKGEVLDVDSRVLKRTADSRTCLMESLKKNGARRGSLSFGESQDFGILGSAHSCSSPEVHCDSRGFPDLSRPQFQIKTLTRELLGSNRGLSS